MKIYTTPLSAHAIRQTGILVSSFPRDIDKKIYVFCESKATLSFEKEIAKTTGGTFNVEITSFSRYVSKNAVVEVYISKAQATLLVRKLMKENAAKLEKLKPEAFSVPKDVYGLISQFKAAMVTPDDLAKVMREEGGTLKTKLKDILIVYSAYEDYLYKNRLTDESAYLSLAPNIILNDAKLKGARVIVAGIQSFTKQTLEILKALNKVSEVDFVCVSANYPSFTNESVNKIGELFKFAEVIPLREDGKDEQYRLAKGLFDPTVFGKAGKSSDKIKIFEAKNIKEECDFITSIIRYEVVEKGRRYKDFSVICQDVQLYAPYLKESAYLYDIPIYADEGASLANHPVIGIIGGLIDVRRFNFLPKKAVTVAKSGLLCGFEESHAFIKYVYENAVHRKQIKEPFSDLVAESVRKKIVDAASLLKSKDEVSSYVSAVKKILDDLDFAKRSENFSEILQGYGEGVTAEFNDAATSRLPSFLDEVAEVLGNAVVSLNEFKNILFSAALAVKVSTVPEYNDTVFLGDYKSGRLHEAAITFMPGLSFDVPRYKEDVALLNDRELLKMDGYKLVIEPKLQIVNDRERENIAVSAMSFTDKLYLSYPLIDKSGKPNLRSEIIDQAIEIFSDETKRLKPITDLESLFSGRFVFLNYSSEKAGDLYASKRVEAYKERKTDNISDVSAFLAAANKDDFLQSFDFKPADAFFNEDLKYAGNLSPTAIETYFSCPYKAFARNVLKLQEAETGETKVYELGNLLHNVMENFIDRYEEITDEAAAELLAEKLFDEQLKTSVYARYLNKPQYKTTFSYLKKESKKECLRVYNDLNKSDFKPYGTEIEFNESSKNGLKPIYLDLGDRKVPIRGKIDRADVYDDGKNKYFRIIDYKTGSAENSDSDFYAGNKIQLYLYMNVFTKLGYKPAGAHYFKMSDDYSQKALDGGEYLGKTLQNAEILKKLDNSVEETGSSKNLGVNVDKKTGQIKEGKTVLSEDEFNKYVSYAVSVAKSGAKEMSAGLFIASPTEKACEYCSYKGMCGYDFESGDENRDISKGNKDSILNAEDEK